MIDTKTDDPISWSRGFLKVGSAIISSCCSSDARRNSRIKSKIKFEKKDVTS